MSLHNIYYYVKIDNQTVAYGQTHNFTLDSFDQTIISNINFNPYSIKSYHTDNELLYSLNSIGHLISGNYDIGIEIKNLNNNTLCSVKVDSLYQVQSHENEKKWI